MEFDLWEVWEIHSLTAREKVLMFHEAQQEKKEMLYQSTVWSTHLQSMVKLLHQCLHKATMWWILLILWLNLFCTSFFLGLSKSYMLKFDISLWTSLLYTSRFACFSFHHLNQSIWNEVISKQILTFATHFAITSRIGERKICQLALTMFTYRIYKVCNFQCRLSVTLKWSIFNNVIIKEFSCEYVAIP